MSKNAQTIPSVPERSNLICPRSKSPHCDKIPKAKGHQTIKTVFSDAFKLGPDPLVLTTEKTAGLYFFNVIK